MSAHFEEVWEKCEALHKEIAEGDTSANLIEELNLKFNLYKMIDLKLEIPQDERQKIKERTLGEILLTLTNISLIDNINVFQALSMALQYKSIEHYSSKYSSDFNHSYIT
jgi:hypothetical protein